MVVDLHSHSVRSDGRLAPAALVDAAASAGVDVLGLTDHDTTEGWAEATAAAAAVGIEVVVGVEMSTQMADADIHLLVYLPDDQHPEFASTLRQIRSGRHNRIGQIIDRLAAVGAPISRDDVFAAALGSVPGRPHVADGLVAAGLANDRADAFDRWLADGRPGYVRKPSPMLPEALVLARAAGGVPVIAHPWSRGSRGVLDEAAIAGLVTYGLAGLEVDHGDHSRYERAELRAICRRLGLLATGSSDYHGEGAAGGSLGSETTSPDVLRSIRAQARQAERES